ncbi:efflux RND transporter periplasmic adaptor subunit [Stieleria sp. TO1_6]|uniref:HlyD family efflux transporter periplasmic adaptor subunit n=1 Tax=Stieleria tagensis TaxID=2956795 RepID=UPI00209B6FC3|nr:HlyD family efflux transporter periplasmic adaptor subunit [Stieleria tagensis]MCO8124278.1 efflux RND transporter periplasmic adaptor subunit [Stieleria tagensis]
MADKPLDLSKLALDRSPTDSGSPSSRRRSGRWFTRYVLPLGILIGFVALLGAAARRQWVSRQPVSVVPVITQRGQVQRAGTTLFQAAGWIEPRPTAISVAALAPGVIEELLVVEGQLVDQGEPVARLIAIDAELAVQQAEATLAIRAGELKRAEAERDAAVVRLNQPVHIRVQLADANSLLAKAKTEYEKLPFLIESAQASLKYSGDNVQGKRAAGDAIAARTVRQAESEHVSAQANLGELMGRGPNLKREINALQNKVDALQTQLELLVEERRQLEEASAKVITASAVHDQAKLQLRQAKLNAERTVVRAPIRGRILRLVTSPGARVMGLDSNAGHSSSTVVQMYDPDRLQVRADVRLEDVPMVTPGAPVEIETASSGNVIHGRVLRPTSSANVQKNTLEVKVELLEPPSTVSPEMLVTATFLAPEVAIAESEKTETTRILVPRQLIHSSDNGAFVWIVDGQDRAVQKDVTTGNENAEGLVEIVTGLTVTDKLIATGSDDLQDGDHVTVVGEESTLGIGS